MDFKRDWWKLLSIILVLYAIVAGLLWDVPRLPILNETIRNLYYHVTMWFAMMILLITSLVFSIKNLRSESIDHDVKAVKFATSGMVLGIAGIITGSVWAKFTWGAYWVSDPKLNGAAVTLLIYLAYFVLRNAIDDEKRKARVSAVYNIFAFVMLIVFIWVIPRMTDSLHPGNGGNPGFSAYESDLDSSMRVVFYPAIIGFTLLGTWLANLQIRTESIRQKLLNR